MMQSTVSGPALAMLAALALPATAIAQDVGSKVPAAALEHFAQTGAESTDDLIGRAVLYEFFAYW